MAIARTDETDLLLPLHDGVHEAQPWQAFLMRLRQRVRADVAGLIVSAGGTAERWIAEPQEGAPPGRAWRLRLRPGRTYALEDGTGFGRVVRADAPIGATAWLSIHRTARDFSAADGALLAGLAPQLAVALRTRASLERVKADRDLAEHASRRASVGWVAFDGDGRIVALSAAAAQSLGPRWLPGAVIGNVAAAARIITDTAPIMTLHDTPAGPLLLLRTDIATGIATPSAALLGLMRTPSQGEAPTRAAVLADLFGLAPSEARLAVAIADGATLAEAAAALGLTIETARNYSKRIFAKARVRGQVDLVRTIAQSLAGLV